MLGGCSQARRRTAAPAKPLRRETSLPLPSQIHHRIPVASWANRSEEHFQRKQGENGAPPPRSDGEKQLAGSWCASLAACVVSEERKGTWRCPRVRSCPLDLFFSSWRPSVSHCLGKEFRDLLSGLTYLLTWHKQGACGRQPGSYPTPFFSPFLSS